MAFLLARPALECGFYPSFGTTWRLGRASKILQPEGGGFGEVGKRPCALLSPRPSSDCARLSSARAPDGMIHLRDFRRVQSQEPLSLCPWRVFPLPSGARLWVFTLHQSDRRERGSDVSRSVGRYLLTLMSSPTKLKTITKKIYQNNKIWRSRIVSLYHSFSISNSFSKSRQCSCF